MLNRLEVHEILKNVSGIENIYFQPPENIKMKYPAIIYSLDDIENNRADNYIYKQEKAYQIIIIDYDPDSELIDKISNMSKCVFVRSYVSDNLNHTIFKKYF